MQNRWIRLFFWLGLICVLTLIAVVGWALVCKDAQSTVALKWLQLLQTLATFLAPAILCAWLWDEHQQPFAWLKMNHAPAWQDVLLVLAIMLCALPAINLLADLNSRVVLPESLSGLEQWMKTREQEAADLTRRFLQADNIGTVMLNIGLMALLPALSEEISFRGTLQQLLSAKRSNSETVCQRSGLSAKRSIVAIWVTAIVFSAIHIQFYGFIPRMLMGAMFGYIFVWSGNLWLPVIMHFTNNAIAVITYSILGESADNQNIADTIGAGDMWWLGVLSLVITCLGLLIFYRRTHTR